MRYLYKYPQAACPYTAPVEGNQHRNRYDFEYELIDPGVFRGQGARSVRISIANTPSTSAFGCEFEDLLRLRREEADRYFATVIPSTLGADAANVMRLAGKNGQRARRPRRFSDIAFVYAGSSVFAGIARLHARELSTTSKRDVWVSPSGLRCRAAFGESDRLLYQVRRRTPLSEVASVSLKLTL